MPGSGSPPRPPPPVCWNWALAPSAAPDVPELDPGTQNHHSSALCTGIRRQIQSTGPGVPHESTYLVVEEQCQRSPTSRPTRSPVGQTIQGHRLDLASWLRPEYPCPRTILLVQRAWKDTGRWEGPDTGFPLEISVLIACTYI